MHDYIAGAENRGTPYVAGHVLRYVIVTDIPRWGDVGKGRHVPKLKPDWYEAMSGN